MRGSLIIPLPPGETDVWVQDPSGVRSPTVYKTKESWPAILLDDESRLGITPGGDYYLYRRLLLLTGEVIEVLPSFVCSCAKL